MSKSTEPHDGQPDGPMAYMARNHVTANLLMIFFLVGGALSALTIKKEVFPEFTLDTLTISVDYPGASPEEVEQGIVLALEEAVRGVENVLEVTATARQGSAQVVVEYEAGADAQQVYQDIQQEVDRIRTFPEDAEEPEIALALRRRDVMEIQLYGDTSEWALRNLAEEVRDRLLQSPGVTQVELDGAREFEVHISPSREALRTYGLTIQDLAERVARTSVEVPAGELDTQSGNVLVRFDERRDYAQEFADIPLITTANGATVRVRDVASVTEGFEDTDRFATYNGQRAIGIEIFRIGDQTPVGVSEAARAALEEIAPSLPEGIHLAINDDDSEIYRQRLELLLKNMGIGIILVLTVLGLSLEPRLALWVTMGIPISFLGTFLIMPMMGVSLNMMSMFAFIIALGIVVDDAIVVGENVHEYRAQGMAPLAAAIRGARDVAVPVVYSILTNCLTFLPIAFMPGTLGKMWAAIPVVVIAVFSISLVESLFVLPSHLGHLSPRPKNRVIAALREGQAAISRRFDWMVEHAFAPFLLGALRLRYLVFAVSITLLSLTLSFALSGRMGMTLMPKVESDTAVVTATLPVGSPLERVEAVKRHLEQAARYVVERHGGERLSMGMYSQLDGNRVETRVYLTEPEVRPISTGEYAALWREAVGEVSGVDTVRFESDRGGPGRGASLTIELSHTDVPTLERAAAHLGTLLAEFPSVTDIDDGFQEGKEQLDFTLKPEGRSLGLTSSEVARQVRHAFEGALPIRQQRGRNEVKVRVFLPEGQRASEYDIEQLMIRTPAGQDVPLRQVADVERGRAYTSILRKDGRRTLEVTANVTPDELTNQVTEALRAEVLPQLLRDFPGLSWSFGGRQSDMRESLASLGSMFIISLLGIYVLLAIPFRSYTQPLVVMVAIPFGIAGAIWGHMMMGYSLSVISMMGIMALSGVVINNALVMIVYANRARAEGTKALEAIHGAGVRRFRPIILTTLTTFGGLAPMIFETSRQARFMIPMAISLGYGLLFATGLILLLVPSLYVMLEDLKRAMARAGALLAGRSPAVAEAKSASAATRA